MCFRVLLRGQQIFSIKWASARCWKSVETLISHRTRNAADIVYNELTPKERNTIGHACVDSTFWNCRATYNRISIHSEFVLVEPFITDSIDYFICGPSLVVTSSLRKGNAQRLHQNTKSGRGALSVLRTINRILIRKNRRFCVQK